MSSTPRYKVGDISVKGTTIRIYMRGGYVHIDNSGAEFMVRKEDSSYWSVISTEPVVMTVAQLRAAIIEAVK